MEQLKALIVDDHKMVRTGIKMMLQNMQIENKTFDIAEAKRGDEAIDMTIRGQFDVVLLDYNLPVFCADDVLKKVLTQKPDQKIIVISNFDEEKYISTALNLGAKSYMYKDIEVDELLHAIKKVLQGETYIPSNVSFKLSEKGDSLKETKDQKVTLLSDREKQILTLIAQEMTNEEISHSLFISKRTVDAHRQNILHKLQLKNTASLIKFAMINNLAS